MPRTTLTIAEIDELLVAYRSSLKKMRFELNQLTDTITALQEMKKERQEAKEAKVAARAEAKAEARAAKKAAKPAAKKAKRGRKPSRTKGYRLSSWDNYLVELIRENGKPMTSAELLAMAGARAAENKTAFDEEKMKGKIARSLQKLANKRGVLGKASARGKGFTYGLGEWFFARSGRLKKAFEV
ncbi:MAG TPA: hypothetical protein P5550_05115 [Bacteroidales bacterium]|nr:hypothetical protein [Bacteroidales bacterium]HRZ77298.1 hypothetical protein [Bacteroidales bacterium]